VTVSSCRVFATLNGDVGTMRSRQRRLVRFNVDKASSRKRSPIHRFVGFHDRSSPLKIGRLSGKTIQPMSGDTDEGDNQQRASRWLSNQLAS
jgi:hypothetical protein